MVPKLFVCGGVCFDVSEGFIAVILALHYGALVDSIEDGGTADVMVRVV